MFEVEKYGETYTIGFDIRYYKSDEGNDHYPDTDNVPSGAYIFKPAKDAQESFRYVDLKKVLAYKGDLVQEMHFIF